MCLVQSYVNRRFFILILLSLAYSNQIPRHSVNVTLTKENANWKDWQDCSAKGKQRMVCGHVGIRKRTCLRMNCCFSPGAHFHEPSCYLPGEGPPPSGDTPKVNQPTFQPTHDIFNGPYTDTEMIMIEHRWMAMFNFENTGAVIPHEGARFHVVLDAAVSIKVLLNLAGDVNKYDDIVKRYVNFVEKTQMHMGQPVFDLDGNPCCDKYVKKPQIAGIIMRVLALATLFERLSGSPGAADRGYAKTKLWPVMLKDVNYIYDRRNEDHYDFWGLTKGNHFFIKLLSRCAIYLGGSYADALGFMNIQLKFGPAVDQLGFAVEAHKGAQYVRETWPEAGNGPKKYMHLDFQTLFAAIFTTIASDAFYEVSELAVQQAVDGLVLIFSGNKFQVNVHDDDEWVPGLLVGRFANDTWNGYNIYGPGNPWTIPSAALAYYYYNTGAAMFLQSPSPAAQKHVHNHLKRHGYHYLSSPRYTHHLHATRAMKQLGDDVLQRLRYHIGLETPQQVNSISGETWGPKQHTMSTAFLLMSWKSRSMIPPV